jgi:hypothetical protein
MAADYRNRSRKGGDVFVEDILPFPKDPNFGANLGVKSDFSLAFGRSID